MKTPINTTIPKLNPSQFDEHIFSDWRPTIYPLYEKFHIERIEYYKNHLNIPVQPHRRSVYFFLYVTKGKIIRSNGLTQYEILANDFFSLPADQITSIEFLSDDLEGFYCHFNPEIFQTPQLKIDLENDFPFFQLTSQPVVSIKDKNKIIPLLEILFQEYQQGEIDRFNIIPLYLTTLFTEVSYNFSQPIKSTANASTQLAQRYKNALSKFVYDKKTVQEFANYLAVSPNHLHKCVKNATGKSAHELLEDMRILEAKVLLRQTNLSISDIAFKIGKFDPSDFSRFFKSKTKYTPLQYRTSKFD